MMAKAATRKEDSGESDTVLPVHPFQSRLLLSRLIAFEPLYRAGHQLRWPQLTPPAVDFSVDNRQI
jgi:hypothetical protein